MCPSKLVMKFATSTKFRNDEALCLRNNLENNGGCRLYPFFFNFFLILITLSLLKQFCLIIFEAIKLVRNGPTTFHQTALAAADHFNCRTNFLSSLPLPNSLLHHLLSLLPSPTVLYE